MRTRGGRLAAREQRLFVGGERRFDIALVCGDRLSELGAVEHRQVCALAGRRHQVSGITEERHPGHAVPSGADRERMNRARDRRGFAVGDQRGEFRRPPVEFGGDSDRRGGGVSEFDAGDPLGGTV